MLVLLVCALKSIGLHLTRILCRIFSLGENILQGIVGGGGGGATVVGCTFLGGSGGMLPQNVFKF